MRVKKIGEQIRSRSHDTHAIRILMMILFSSSIVLRVPNVIIHGRFWAEEGIFYQNAWDMHPLNALKFSYGGYLNIIGNASSIIARYLVPIDYAPFITTLIGGIFQALPAILILTSEASWLNRPICRIAAVVVLASALSVGEVSLQTVLSQYHLAICVALILSFDDYPRPIQRWFRRVVLFLAPLSGILAIALIPLYLIKLWYERTRERLMQAGLLSAGAIIQLSLFFAPAERASLQGTDGPWAGVVLYAMTVRQLVVPFFGLNFGSRIGGDLLLELKSGIHPIWPFLVLLIAVSPVVVIGFMRRNSAIIVLLTCALLIAIFSYYAAIEGGSAMLDPRAGIRYDFAPSVLFQLSIIACFDSLYSSWLRLFPAIFALWLVGIGITNFQPYGYYSISSGPDWAAEVARWRADTDYAIALWPSPWSMHLTLDHSPIKERAGAR